MSFLSWLVSTGTGLPPRENKVSVQRDIAVTAGGGVDLLTDHYAPLRDGPSPTLLMRVPYGRKSFDFVARSYATRGFHVVLQACRGTDGSGGDWEPLVNERADGLATLDWLKGQDWFDGRLGVSGPSYMGYCAWAISDALPPGAAIATKVTSAEFESVVFPQGALHLQLWVSWLQTVEGLRGQSTLMALKMLTGAVERITEMASKHLPLREVDSLVLGHEEPFWQRWFDNAFDNPQFWQPIDHRARITEKTPANMFVSGWYDFMIDQLLRDYRAMVDKGHKPHLTIGPWTHTSGALNTEGLRQTIPFMHAKLDGRADALRRKPVRIEIMGGGGWRDFESFPPPGIGRETLYLGGGSTLSPALPEPSQPDRYRYDPADPTPNLGGAIFAFQGSGRVDNRPLEAREDVLVYTGAVLTRPVTIIGNVEVVLYVASSLAHTDFFVRLCDVDQRGRSSNICDRLFRIAPGMAEADEAGVYRLAFTLHATAHRFGAGHRIRVQVSSGAHPRYARNLGTGEPVGSATTMLVAEQTVFHEPGRASCVTLPVFEGE